VTTVDHASQRLRGHRTTSITTMLCSSRVRDAGLVYARYPICSKPKKNPPKCHYISSSQSHKGCVSLSNQARVFSSPLKYPVVFRATSSWYSLMNAFSSFVNSVGSISLRHRGTMVTCSKPRKGLSPKRYLVSTSRTMMTSVGVG